MSFCPEKFNGMIKSMINNNYSDDYLNKTIKKIEKLSNCEGKSCGKYNQCHGIKYGRKIHVLGDDNDG
ncbi:MAG: hypothetical protein ACOCP8_01415 [archaeon]